MLPDHVLIFVGGIFVGICIAVLARALIREYLTRR